MSELGITWKSCSIILAAGVLVLSGMYYRQYSEIKAFEMKFEEQQQELERIKLNYNQLAELVDLCTPPSYFFASSFYPSGVTIRSGYSLKYYKNLINQFSYQGPEAAVIYNWLENSTLELDLTIVYPKPGLYVPLTVQMGNAFLNNSVSVYEEKASYTVCYAPVYWKVNATVSGKYSVTLPTKGWYTICLSGKIMRYNHGGEPTHRLIGVQYINGTFSVIEEVYVWMNFKIIHEGRDIPFALNEDYLNYFFFQQ